MKIGTSRSLFIFLALTVISALSYLIWMSAASSSVTHTETAAKKLIVPHEQEPKPAPMPTEMGVVEALDTSSHIQLKMADAKIHDQEVAATAKIVIADKKASPRDRNLAAIVLMQSGEIKDPEYRDVFLRQIHDQSEHPLYREYAIQFLAEHGLMSQDPRVLTDLTAIIVAHDGMQITACGTAILAAQRLISSGLFPPDETTGAFPIFVSDAPVRHAAQDASASSSTAMAALEYFHQRKMLDDVAAISKAWSGTTDATLQRAIAYYTEAEKKP